MKSLLNYIYEEGTPGNTMGMGNPAAPDGDQVGTEPIIIDGNAKCKKEKKYKKHLKKLKESLLDDEEDLLHGTNIINSWIEDNCRIKGTYEIVDGKINVNGSVIINKDNVTEIPFPFGKVTGFFWADHSKLKNLKNIPEYVGKSMAFDDNEDLETTEGIPPKCKIKSYLSFYDCPNLENIHGLENVDIGEELDLERCISLKNLEGLPKFGSNLILKDCTGLKTLKGGEDTILKGELIIQGCTLLKDLTGCPHFSRRLKASSCKNLESLKGFPKNATATEGILLNQCSKLKSLEGLPDRITGTLSCLYCESLKTLKGAPKVIGKNFDCSYCENLESLDDGPTNVDLYFCEGCPKIPLEIPSNLKYHHFISNWVDKYK